MGYETAILKKNTKTESVKLVANKAEHRRRLIKIDRANRRIKVEGEKVDILAQSLEYDQNVWMVDNVYTEKGKLVVQFEELSGETDDDGEPVGTGVYKIVRLTIPGGYTYDDYDTELVSQGRPYYDLVRMRVFFEKKAE